MSSLKKQNILRLVDINQNETSTVPVKELVLCDIIARNVAKDTGIL